MLFLKKWMRLSGGSGVNSDCNSEARSGPHVWRGYLSSFARPDQGTILIPRSEIQLGFAPLKLSPA